MLLKVQISGWKKEFLSKAEGVFSKPSKRPSQQILRKAGKLPGTHA